MSLYPNFRMRLEVDFNTRGDEPVCVVTGGGCCARGDEPVRSVEVRNFLMSSETVSSVFYAVTNLDMMVPVSAARVFLVRSDCGLYSGYHATRFIPRPHRPAVNTRVLAVLLRTSRPCRNTVSNGATTDSFQIPDCFLFCGWLTDVLIQLWLGV